MEEDSKKIRLISEDILTDEMAFDADPADPSWREGNSNLNSGAGSISESAATHWITACQRLRGLPEDYEPEKPYFNATNFDFSLSGCSSDEAWMMCKDFDQPFNPNSNGSRCYGEDGIMNLANFMPAHYAYPIYGVIFPILVSFAVVANVFVLLVLSKRHMQSPTNIVLLYMSMADLTVGLVPLPFTFYWFTLRNYATPWRLTPAWCYGYHYLMDALPPICHNVAIWLTVLLAAQRYVYIEFPVRAQSICTIQNVKRASIGIVAVSIICGAMKFGDSLYDTYRGYIMAPTTQVAYSVGVCLIQWPSFVRWIGHLTYLDIYFWIRAVVFVWFPSTLLICLNVLLIRAIHRAQRRRDRLLSESRNREANRQKESNTTTMMLVIIVSIFLVVNCPQGLNIALLTINNKLHLDLPFLREDNYEPALALMIANMLIIATYPLNFAIYCSMSTQFRETFKHLFCTNVISEAATRRTSSYYGYAPVAGSRTNTFRNGSAPDSSTSLMHNSKMKKRGKDSTNKGSSRATTETLDGPSSKDSNEKENVDTCV